MHTRQKNCLLLSNRLVASIIWGAVTSTTDTTDNVLAPTFIPPCPRRRWCCAQPVPLHQLEVIAFPVIIVEVSDSKVRVYPSVAWNAATSPATHRYDGGLAGWFISTRDANRIYIGPGCTVLGSMRSRVFAVSL
ncbi:hypothetical protein PF005_g5429 [Phytophthora fragariae]|uniref:Secreted protein n=1 Tax=Phytophthora fragariae TaxID=53985 RepID=A0A6A3YVD3_9STRA|nr:hypothetical protein PF003_g20945 [Phytophthora fragariae]KAE8948669.1 hypothetical protein PF009_g1779 [Phytophthora fragariae]KAE9022854.1 hypothetical protein PF011_g4252 [Phytophthora fragariae]KAE9127681.1 hypothetical protein PF007_g5518 [Phytophthora fragariae]KAE9128018.1 hypothetical protein PF010_g4655 [Phytophthora fragariae]